MSLIIEDCVCIRGAVAVLFGEVGHDDCGERALRNMPCSVAVAIFLRFGLVLSNNTSVIDFRP